MCLSIPKRVVEWEGEGEFARMVLTLVSASFWSICNLRTWLRIWPKSTCSAAEASDGMSSAILAVSGNRLTDE